MTKTEIIKQVVNNQSMEHAYVNLAFIYTIRITLVFMPVIIMAV